MKGGISAHWSLSDLPVEGEEDIYTFLHRDWCQAAEVSLSNKFGGCVNSVSFRRTGLVKVTAGMLMSSESSSGRVGCSSAALNPFRPCVHCNGHHLIFFFSVSL